jgi:hypothetical protein
VKAGEPDRACKLECAGEPDCATESECAGEPDCAGDMERAGERDAARASERAGILAFACELVGCGDLERADHPARDGELGGGCSSPAPRVRMPDITAVQG